jgi:hypothetical protein
VRGRWSVRLVHNLKSDHNLEDCFCRDLGSNVDLVKARRRERQKASIISKEIASETEWRLAFAANEITIKPKVKSEITVEPKVKTGKIEVRIGSNVEKASDLSEIDNEPFIHIRNVLIGCGVDERQGERNVHAQLGQEAIKRVGLVGGFPDDIVRRHRNQRCGGVVVVVELPRKRKLSSVDRQSWFGLREASLHMWDSGMLAMMIELVIDRSRRRHFQTRRHTRIRFRFFAKAVQTAIDASRATYQRFGFIRTNAPKEGK